MESHAYMVMGIAHDDQSGDTLVRLLNPYGTNRNVGEGTHNVGAGWDDSSAEITVRLNKLVEQGSLGEFNIGPAPEAQTREQGHGASPEAPTAVEQFLAAVRTGDRESMRTAAIAFSGTERGQQALAEVQERILAGQQRLPDRDNPLFTQALIQLERLGPQEGGYADRAGMERSAGTIAYQAKLHHMQAIDDIVPSPDGRELTAIRTNPANGVRDQTSVDKLQASMQPLEQSLRGLSAETQQQERDASIQIQQQAAQLPPDMSR